MHRKRIELDLALLKLHDLSRKLDVISFFAL
jgi:hypothetical protein